MKFILHTVWDSILAILYAFLPTACLSRVKNLGQNEFVLESICLLSVHFKVNFKKVKPLGSKNS